MEEKMDTEVDASDELSAEEDEVVVSKHKTHILPPPEPPLAAPTSDNKTEELTWIKQKKSNPVWLKGKTLSNHLKGWIPFLKSNFGSINNMFKLLGTTKEGKEGITLFLRDMDVLLPQDLLEKSFNKGVFHTLQIFKKHLHDISLTLFTLPGVTEDLFEAVRSLLSYVGSSLLSFGTNQKMPTLYSSRHLRNLRKKEELVSCKSLFFTTAEKEAGEEADKYKRLHLRVHIQYHPLSFNRKQLSAFHELWQVYGLKLFQVYKMDGFVEGLNGLIKTKLLGAEDASVLRFVGSNVIVYFLRIHYDPEIFKPHVQEFLSIPHPSNLVYGNETKEFTRCQLRQVGAQFCDLEQFELKVTEQLSFKGELTAHVGDGSNQWKFLEVCGGTGHHKCPSELAASAKRTYSSFSLKQNSTIFRGTTCSPSNRES